MKKEVQKLKWRNPCKYLEKQRKQMSEVPNMIEQEWNQLNFTYTQDLIWFIILVFLIMIWREKTKSGTHKINTKGKKPFFSELEYENKPSFFSFFWRK